VLSAITASADGSVWGLDDEHGLQRLDDPQPVPNPPDLRVTSIAATSATQLWALMTNEDTQIWDGASWREGCRKSELDRIERIAAASDGMLWSTYAGAVSQCIHGMWSSFPSSTGIERLAPASAGALYALGYEDRALHRWNDDAGWEMLDESPMNDLSASADGLVLGVDPADGRLCLFLGGQVGWAQTNFMGLGLVAAGSVNCVWGVEADGEIVDFTAHGPFVER
jgi:hypothetical protein